MPRGPHDEEIQRNQKPENDHARERLEEFLRKRSPQDKAESVEDKAREGEPGQATEKPTTTNEKK